jgi:triphosphoribosyl-dephospho-CoA synthase
MSRRKSFGISLTIRVNQVATSAGLCAQLACVWEVTARKPGNVHRFADFEDAGFLDNVQSALAIGPALEGAAHRPVGATVLEAVRATRRVTRTNTNLGIVLLLAPLAAVPDGQDWAAGLERVLANLDVADARAVYQAIRLAVPGGLGQVPEQDVAGEPTLPLRQVMELAADRDLIALQYAGGFREVLEEGIPALELALGRGLGLEEAIIACHLGLMALHADTLIVRKRGMVEAEEARRRARQVLDSGWPETNAGREALADLDRWLRAEGHQRNPGSTADLVTACLFVAVRGGIIQLPLRIPW